MKHLKMNCMLASKFTFFEILKAVLYSHILHVALSLYIEPTNSKPTLFFILQFAFTIIHRSGRVVKTGKVSENSSREWHRVDIGGQGPTASQVKHGQADRI